VTPQGSDQLSAADEMQLVLNDLEENKREMDRLLCHRAQMERQKLDCERRLGSETSHDQL